MRKRLSANAIEQIERRVTSSRGDRPREIFGLVNPDGSIRKCLKQCDDRSWIDTQESPTVYILSKLERALVSTKRFVVVIGGRGSGKSLGVSDIILADIKDNGNKAYFLREFQESIEDSEHSLLKGEIGRLKLTGFSWTNNAIVHTAGGSAKYRGLARNPESIKSAHGFKKFKVEEAQFISAESLKALTPTARNKAISGLPTNEIQEDKELDQVQMYFVGNPKSSGDPFSQRFIVPFEADLLRDGYYEDDLHTIIIVNYVDNPWFAQSGLEAERQFDKANRSQAYYEHVWLGRFMDGVDNSIIPVEWFDACIDAHIKLGFKPTGAITVSHDPSDNGSDDKGAAVRHGNVILDIRSKSGVDAFAGMKWATDIAREFKADNFIWDGDGLGATLREHVTAYLSGVKIEKIMFRGSGEVNNPEAVYKWEGRGGGVRNNKSNKETFANKRAQKYWDLRDRVYNTYRAIVLGEYIDPDLLISFSSGITNIALFKAQVCRIPLAPNSSGKILIMSKQDMKTKLKMQSPNEADSVMMSMDSPEIIIKHQTIMPQPIKRLPAR